MRSYSKYFRKLNFSVDNEINLLKQVYNIKKFYIPFKKKKTNFIEKENIIVLLSII